jgi:DNA-binding NarL/FixJ family response regulator
MNTRIDAALILWNRDVIELFSMVLQQRNLKSCGVEPSAGHQRIEDFIVSCDPSVVVFDLDPPYDRSAAIALQLLDRFPDRSFVITCADSVRAVKAAPWLCCHPIFQKPYEMDEIANTVRAMVRRSCRNAVAVAVGM